MADQKKSQQKDNTSQQEDNSSDQGHKKSQQEEQEELWKRAFDLFDKNKDGTISLNELGMVLRSVNLNPTEKEVKAAIKKLDKDGNGRCDFEDFKILMREMVPTQEGFSDEMYRAFKIFDQNRNNVIERKEIRYVLTSLTDAPLTEEELDYMMKYADLNGDGLIDYGEFVKLCMKPCL